MSLIDLIKVDYNKILGKGYSGIIYLGTYNNNKYAIKFGKQSDKSDYRDTLYIFWCKLNFKYPGLFLTLFDYRLDTNNIKIDFSDTDLSKFPMEFRKEKLKKWESKYTAIECFSLIDDVLPSIYNVKKKIYYNCFIQYAYLIYILHMENTMNGDVHANNVGIIYTKSKYTKILDYNIKTYGYKIQMIDYEEIEFIDSDVYKNNKDFINGTYFMLIRFGIFFKVNNILCDCSKFEKYYNNYINVGSVYDKNFIIDDKYNLELKKYLPDEEIYNSDIILKFLYKILYQKQFQKQLLKSNFKKFIPFKLLLSLDTILFIIKNMKKPNVILYYLLANTKTYN